MTLRYKKYLEKWDGWPFLYKLDRYDDNIAFAFSHNFKPERNQEPHNHRFHTTVRGLKYFMNKDHIIQVTKIPRGQPWDKYECALNLRERTSFFKSYE